ncbi:uncharacterized protein DEA37_0003345, partial [Paragonimus westermani]
MLCSVHLHRLINCFLFTLATVLASSLYNFLFAYVPSCFLFHLSFCSPNDPLTIQTPRRDGILSSGRPTHIPIMPPCKTFFCTVLVSVLCEC